VLILPTALFAVCLLNLVRAGYSVVLLSVLAELFPVATQAVGIFFQL
jgi:hypothetical protein